MRLKLISTTRDSYTVYLDNTVIGTVRRIYAKSDSRTQWKAEGIGFDFNKFGFNTKTEAAEALSRAYQTRGMKGAFVPGYTPYIDKDKHEPETMSEMIMDIDKDY